MHAYQGRQTTQSGLLLVVAAHLLVIYAMWTGLNRVAIDRIRPPMDAVTVQDVKPPEPETQPLPTPPLAKAPQVVVPVQDILIDTPPEAPRITVPMTRDALPTTPDTDGRTSDRTAMVMPAVRKEFRPAYRVEPTYPRQAQREGRAGTVVARLYVAANGSVERVEVVSRADPVFEREVVRTLSQWRFHPEPVGFVGEYQIVFSLKD